MWRVKDKEYFEKTIEKIVATREHAKKRLTELGFTFPNSQSNFIFASHKSVPAEKIFEALKKEQIYVRYFKTPGLDNSLRISIGTDEEMDTLFRLFGSIFTPMPERKMSEWINISCV